MINFLNLKDTLKSANYAALCLAGNDRWLKQNAIASVCKVYGIEDDGFGVDTLESPTYIQIENACCTPSMFNPKKLVVCESFMFPQGKQQQDIISKLSKLVESCDGSFCLVFCAESSAGFDKISGLTVVNCDRLDIANVAKWVVAYAKRQGVAVDNICAQTVAEYCLQDMSRVATETQKLLDYGEFSLQSIELLVHKDTEYQIFDLSKKIAAKNAQGAIELYKGLIASGEKPNGIFGLLYNTYRRAYYAKTSTDFASDQLATYLGVKPYAVGKAKELAEGYKPMQLKRILNLFEQADIKLKAFMDETEVMTTLIMQIIAM